MKTISPELQAHLDSGLTTMATCCKITRVDGVEIHFTDHIKKLLIDGDSYDAAFGYTPSESDTKSDLSTSNMEIIALLDSPKISSRDIMVGLFDGARVDFFAVNYETLSMGRIHLPAAIMGDVTIEKGRFTAELMGMMGKLSQYYGQSTSIDCPADLGDAACGVDMTASARSFTGITSGASSRDKIQAADRTEDDRFFKDGSFEFTSGDNQGLVRDIKIYETGVFVLTLPVPFDVPSGITYTCTIGCDKTVEECELKFDNVIRFRGQPFMVSTDDLLKIGSQ